MGFCWRAVSTDFWLKTPGSCTKSPFAEDFRTGKLGGEACVLRCVCLYICLLFVYLFIVCLFVCLLFIYFKGAVCWVMHKLYGLAPLRGMAISVELRGGFYGLALTYFVLLWV